MIDTISGISCTKNVRFVSGISAVSGIKNPLPDSFQAFYPFLSDLVDEVSGTITASFANAPTFGGGGINTVANTDITVPTILEGGADWDTSGDFIFGYTNIGKTAADLTGQVLLQSGNMGITTGIGITFAEIGASISSLPVDSDTIIGECLIKYVGGMLSIVIDGVESTPVSSAVPSIGAFAQIGANILNMTPAPGTYGGLLFEALPINLGPELQPNSDMSLGDSSWTNSGATVTGVTHMGEQAVLIEQNIAGDFKWGEMTVPTLEMGPTYRVKIRAAVGGAGSSQQVGWFSYGSNSLTDVDSSSFQDFEFNVLSAAVSGTTRCFVSTASGVMGGQLYISEISIRKIL